jgi:hypothetical protein
VARHDLGARAADLPADDVDGRYLFDRATERYQAVQAGRPPEPISARRWATS